MRKFLHLTAMTAAVLLTVSCNENNNGNPEPPAPTVPTAFAKGADISWATEMAADGIKFRNAAGEERECTALMKELGFDAVRYRVWVNPPEGWCAEEDVVAKAKVAASLGMRIMIDFHYSDWWADPSKQDIPEASQPSGTKASHPNGSRWATRPPTACSGTPARPASACRTMP